MLGDIPQNHCFQCNAFCTGLICDECNGWELGDSTKDDCPRCKRQNLCKCENGKTRCKKCNWVVEDKEYCFIPLD